MTPIRGTRTFVAVLAAVLGIAVVPHRWCERDASALYAGETTEPLAASVARWTNGGTPLFHTGSPLFDSEWTYATYTMAATGFGQLAAEHPDRRAEHLRAMETALRKAETHRAYDTAPWGHDAFSESIGHISSLGYAGLPLALHRELAPDSPLRVEEERYVAAIEKRFDTGLAETYPHVTFPVDNAPALAALAVHARITGKPSPALARGLAAMRREVDPATGLLRQSNHDGPRGSGTALAAYFLAYADPALSAQLYAAVRKHLFSTVIGFGAVLENPDGSSRGDIDSGPVVLGFGVSATGFAIGASRANGDPETYRSLYATAHLFGAPRGESGFVTGGCLGDAVLFAMITAPRPRA